ncbi:MAG: hypothetical protein KatS3mg066_2783 [Fischerella sp.]|nr:MAG: hypothetical protein KatS3mg066_2783 [Fischerella sp.]
MPVTGIDVVVSRNFTLGLDQEWEQIASDLLMKVKQLWMPMN